MAITIRPAVAEDSDAIVRIYLESAEHHASLDPERYWIPAVEMISARYREGRQHRPQTDGENITLVVDLGGEIVGFIDARSNGLRTRCIVKCSTAALLSLRSASRVRVRASGNDSCKLRKIGDESTVPSWHRWSISPQTRVPAAHLPAFGKCEALAKSCSRGQA